MNKLLIFIFGLLPAMLFAQEDTTAYSSEQLKIIVDSIDQKTNQIVHYIDSVRAVLQAERDAAASPGVWSYTGSTGKDTAYIRVAEPKLSFSKVSPAPIDLITHYNETLKKSEDIHNYYDAYFKDELKVDLYVILLNEEGDWCYSGYWRPNGFISDVIEYEIGLPVREWEKAYGQFRLKE